MYLFLQRSPVHSPTIVTSHIRKHTEILRHCCGECSLASYLKCNLSKPSGLLLLLALHEYIKHTSISHPLTSLSERGSSGKPVSCAALCVCVCTVSEHAGAGMSRLLPSPHGRLNKLPSSTSLHTHSDTDRRER